MKTTTLPSTNLTNRSLLRAFLLMPLVLACFALSPQTQAQCVDGCNTISGTFQGDGALISNSSGLGNSAFGWRTLFSNSTGNFNTGCGGGVLALNNADSNTGVGAAALLLNDAGTRNTAVGTDALVFNGFGVSDDGDFNGAFGAFALFNNLDGFSNNAFGDSALFANIKGFSNSAFGDSALVNNDSSGAGIANFNTAVGAEALASNVDGSSNNAFGFNALGANITGSFNIAIGGSALVNNVSGFSNTVIGDAAGVNLVQGKDNIYIGQSVHGPSDEDSHIRIGDPDRNRFCFISGISGTPVVGDPVVVDGNGQLGTVASAARFKKEIKPIDKTSEAILALKPVSFQYKSDSKGTRQFGLIAEEVAKVNPDLVVRDRKGEIYSVRYDAVNAMLLNEFLKEHRTVQELKSIVAKQEAHAVQQQKQIDALTAGLQKVSAQLEASKSAPQTVLNDQ